MDHISAIELKNLIDEKADFQLVDCRETHEFEFSHIPGAINQPRFLIRKGEFGDLKKDKKIVLYCLSNMNCPAIRDILLENGFIEVRCLDKGFADWIDEIDPEMDFYL